jgi:uncharacterized protein YndB with AHSA1/START domain
MTDSSDTRIIEKSILIDAPSPSVWNALTNPEIIKQWLFETEIEVISDWKPGSPIVFKGKFKNLEACETLNLSLVFHYFFLNCQ